MIGHTNPQALRIVEETIANLSQLETCIAALRVDIAGVAQYIGHPEAAQRALTPSASWQSPLAHQAAAFGQVPFQQTGAFGQVPFQQTTAFGQIPFAGVNPWATQIPFAGVNPWATQTPYASQLPYASTVAPFASLGALNPLAQQAVVSPYAQQSLYSPALSAGFQNPFAASVPRF